MSTATERLGQAQASLLAAQAVIAVEHLQSLEEQLKSAKEEGRAIDERLKKTGSSLAAKQREAEPLWTQRDAISRARQALDNDFQALDFSSDKETEEYEQKRATLTDEWHKWTEKITALGSFIGQAEHELCQLKFARSRTVNAVNDLRNAIAERRGKNRF
jgi:chromosome segregation ATPase